MQQRPKSEINLRLRDAQRRWLAEVARRTGETFTEIARGADVSPSTLTRFMNREDYEGTLAALTISQISARWNVPASADVRGSPEASGFAEEAVPFLPGGGGGVDTAILALIGDRKGADPWTLRTRALEDAGYIPGDVVILDLNAQAKAGDAVCAQVYDWGQLRAQTVWRIYDPPYLIAASRDARLRKPLVVDNQRVIIKGVITGMVRAAPA